MPCELLMQDQLFKDFVRKIPGKNYSSEIKQKRINKALEKIKAHYYWIMPLDKDSIWDDFSKELPNKYPKIIVLKLDDNDEKEGEEADLFDPLHQLINY